MRREAAAALVALALAPAAAHAHPGPRASQTPTPLGPLNDLLALGQAGGQTPQRVPVVRRDEPPLEPAPRARCGPGDRPEPGIQGRVPAGSAEDGLWCNMTLVGRHGTAGGFKVLRYTDTAGRECAYYDTALLFPFNAIRFGGPSLGVAVLDMSDPSRPVQTDTLTELPMLSPHESLSLNPRRGLIAAVLGNPTTYPGLVSIYDASQDCRHPVHQSTSLVARFGHESGFAPDGRTFYATGTAVQAITAIDVTDPRAPRPLWHGNVVSHGMTLSDDGDRAYVADIDGNLLTLDTSEIQARRPKPEVREISRLTWGSASIPQNAIPFTRDGRPYVLEFDEYTAGTTGAPEGRDVVGAARIIDIADERRPRVVSNLRLAVNQPAEHRAAGGDPGAQSPVQGYAAHYCNVPTRVDPKLVACSFIASGLRLFDIGDLERPKEIAYHVAPTRAALENGFQASSFAMAQPAFAPERREVWYSDGASGFYVLRVDERVWPRDAAPASRPPCRSRRSFLVRARVPRAGRVRSVRATLGGRRVPVVRRGNGVGVRVDLRGRPRGTVRLVVRVRTADGRTATTRRTYRPCVRRKAR